jgi:hypothetical protein
MAVNPRNITQQSTNRAIAALDNAIKNFANDALPFALEGVGERVVEYIKQTHTYNNRTYNLEESTAYALIPPKSSAKFIYFDKDLGSQEEVEVNNPDDSWLLIYGVGKDYGKFVELNLGFDVAVQGHLMLRREFLKLVGQQLKGRRIAP